MSNSWSGLFTKLLTGSTVLKVESPMGFRQWYYDRLKPFEHYVPVRPDLAEHPCLWILEQPCDLGSSVSRLQELLRLLLRVDCIADRQRSLELVFSDDLALLGTLVR